MSKFMKDGMIEWIGMIPIHWKIARIKQFFTIVNGATPKSDNPDYWNGDIVWVTPADMFNVTTINNSSRKITEAGYLSCATILAPIGSVVLSTRAPIGQVAMTAVELCTNQGCKTLIDKETASGSFIYYLLSVSAELLNILGKGTTFLELSTRDLGNYTFGLPSIEEQQQIVSFLEVKCKEVDSLIKLQEEMIVELQAYKQSIITETVTKGIGSDVVLNESRINSLKMIPVSWNISRLKYEVILNPRTAHELDDDDLVSYAPMECVGNGELERRKIEYKSVKKGYTVFNDGDIIMAKVTPCFENGNIAVATNLMNGIGFGSTELFVFRPRNILGRWLFYYLQNEVFKENAKATMTGTGGLKRVSPSFVANHHFTYPNSQAQTKIVEYLDEKCSEIQNMIQVKQSKIDTLKKYKQSLIYECVTGKRDCRPQEERA